MQVQLPESHSGAELGKVMAGLYILLWFCQQLKTIPTLSAQVCEVFSLQQQQQL